MARADGNDLMLDRETVDGGVPNAVRSNDDRFPPDFRLSRSGRERRDDS
ncbi:hypothetical protein [Streptomyces sp. N50]|nr:hypothetical protein [Streptomyces sp. N50]WOX14716.1 hypothetical protein R2B38_40390 [Streptomyces sp. N50]